MLLLFHVGPMHCYYFLLVLWTATISCWSYALLLIHVGPIHRYYFMLVLCTTTISCCHEWQQQKIHEPGWLRICRWYGGQRVHETWAGDVSYAKLLERYVQLPWNHIEMWVLSLPRPIADPRKKKHSDEIKLNCYGEAIQVTLNMEFKFLSSTSKAKNMF